MPQFRSREALADALSNDAEFQALPEDQQTSIFADMASQIIPETIGAPRPLTPKDFMSEPLINALLPKKFHLPKTLLNLDPFKTLAAGINTAISVAEKSGTGRPLHPLDQFTTELRGGELDRTPLDLGMRNVFSNLPMLLAARPAVKAAGEAVESLHIKIPDVLQRSRSAKTMEELMAVPDDVLHTLPMEQIKKVFEARSRQAALGAQAERHALRLQQVQQTRALSTERQSLTALLREQSDQAVLRLREVAPQALTQHSEHFRSLIQSDLEKTGSEAISVDAKALINELEGEFKDRPELLDHVLDRLNLGEFLEEKPSSILAPSGQPTSFTGSSRISARELFDRTQAIRQNIPRSMIEGRSSYNMGHLAEDKVTDSVLKILEREGVQGLGQARTFWKDWAPTRNTLIRRIGLTGETSPGASFLRSAAIDPGIKRSVRKIEEEVGADLTSEIVNTYQKLQGNQQAKSQLIEDLLNESQRISTVQADLKAGRISQEFAILERSQARMQMRKRIKTALMVGAGGIAGTEGLRRLGVLNRP